VTAGEEMGRRQAGDAAADDRDALGVRHTVLARCLLSTALGFQTLVRDILHRNAQI
jgi:hypothetical protein